MRRDRAVLKDQGGLDVGNLRKTGEARDSDTPVTTSVLCDDSVGGIFFGRLVVYPVPAR